MTHQYFAVNHDRLWNTWVKLDKRGECLDWWLARTSCPCKPSAMQITAGCGFVVGNASLESAECEVKIYFPGLRRGKGGGISIK